MYVEKKYFVIYDEGKKKNTIYKFIEEGLVNNRIKPIFNRIPSKEFIVDVKDYLRLFNKKDVICNSYSFPDEIDLNAVNFIVVREMDSRGKYYMCCAFETQDDEPKLELPQVKINCVLEDDGSCSGIMKAELYYNPFNHRKTVVSRWYIPPSDELDPTESAIVRIPYDSNEGIQLLPERKLEDLLNSPVFGYRKEIDIQSSNENSYRLAYTRLGKINPYNEVVQEIAISTSDEDVLVRGDMLIFKMEGGKPVGIPSEELEEIMKLLGR